MKITPKYFSRKFPPMIDGEITTTVLQEGDMRMFIRDDDSDRDYPARTCVQLSRSEVIRLIDDLQHNLKSMREVA